MPIDVNIWVPELQGAKDYKGNPCKVEKEITSMKH